MTKDSLPWTDIAPAPPMRHEPHATTPIALGRGGGALGRRSFLKTLGISGVVSLAGCERLPVEHALPLSTSDEDSHPGKSVHYASTCTACSAACGLLVTTRDGRPIKLEGLAEHPLSKGGLCALAQASVRGLYDAGRLRKPLLDGNEASWDAVDQRVRAALPAAAGKLAVLTPTISSPTARRLLLDFVAKHRGRLVEYDPGVHTASGAREAYRLLDGASRYPALALEEASLLLTLGGDPLGTGPDAVSLTRAYADRRRERKQGRAFQHVHVEGNLSLSGAGADVRIQASAAERALMAAHLLGKVAAAGAGAAAQLGSELTRSLAPLEAHAHKLADLAAELIHHGRHALVVSSSRQPAEQVAVALINRILGAEEVTLSLREPSEAQRGSDTELSRLLSDLEGGRIAALFVVDLNPVEQLPGGDELAGVIKNLPLSVAITSRPSATAHACTVVAAAHHGLECWGDAAPRRRALTVVQPTSRPLFDTRDPMDSFLAWSGEKAKPYRQYLRESWKAEVLAELPFEAMWNHALANGMVAPELAAASFAGSTPASDAAAAPDRSALAKLMAGLAAASDSLEVELLEEVGPRDGRNAFNPWLRELPDPLTRGAWTPTVRLAPALAAARGIADGDVVSVSVGDTAVEMQARVMPGQHPRVIGVPVGYGVADGDGGEAKRNGYRLAKLQGGVLVTAGLGASIANRGKGAALPLMQWQSDPQDRPIIFQVSSHDEEIPESHHPSELLWGDDRQYSPHWHMVIDLDSCTGCSACVVACQAENNLPVVGPQNITDHRDMYWLRIDRYFVGDADDPEVLFEPMLCAQCDNAPCETVCPVAATVHSHDGLNMQAYNRCVGTRYCANNCPYKVRRFNWFDFTPKDPLERMVLNPDVVVRDRGTMEKCTFCVQRIQQARIAAKADAGIDPLAVQTACQQSCPAQAISFGDGDSSERLREQRHQPRAFQVLADLGIRPSITYLARVRQRDAKRGTDT